MNSYHFYGIPKGFLENTGDLDVPCWIFSYAKVLISVLSLRIFNASVQRE